MILKVVIELIIKIGTQKKGIDKTDNYLSD
jgi:hypothetical protein